MIGSHESLKERVVLKVIFMWRDIDVQSVIVKTFLSRKLGIIQDCIEGIAVHGLNGSGKMS